MSADTTTANPTQGDGKSAQFSVLGQYIKDLSFESPRAPQTLQNPGENPNLNVNVNVSVRKLGEEVFESQINFEAQAKNDAGVIYNMELAYAGAFRLQGIPEEALQPVLFVNCPTLLYPFVRQITASITRDGGFPPLLIDPIDFGLLYQKNLQKSADKTKKEKKKEKKA